MSLVSKIKSVFKPKAPLYKNYTPAELKVVAMKTRIVLEEYMKKCLHKIGQKDSELVHRHKMDTKNYDIMQEIGRNVIEVESIKIHMELLRKIEDKAILIVKTNGDIALLRTELRWFQAVLWYRKCKEITNMQEIYDFCFNFFKGIDVTMELNVRCDIFKLFEVLRYLSPGCVVPLEKLYPEIRQYIRTEFDDKELQDIFRINKEEIRKWFQREKIEAEDRFFLRSKSRSPIKNPRTPPKPAGNPYGSPQGSNIRPTTNQLTKKLSDLEQKKEQKESSNISSSSIQIRNSEETQDYHNLQPNYSDTELHRLQSSSFSSKKDNDEALEELMSIMGVSKKQASATSNIGLNQKRSEIIQKESRLKQNEEDREEKVEPAGKKLSEREMSYIRMLDDMAGQTRKGQQFPQTGEQLAREDEPLEVPEQERALEVPEGSQNRRCDKCGKQILQIASVQANLIFPKGSFGGQVSRECPECLRGEGPAPNNYDDEAESIEFMRQCLRKKEKPIKKPYMVSIYARAEFLAKK